MNKRLNLFCSMIICESIFQKMFEIITVTMFSPNRSNYTDEFIVMQIFQKQ